MKSKALLAINAALETGTGVALVLAPSGSTIALLGSPIDSPAGSVITRVLGASLFSLGIACWFSRDEARCLVAAVFVYNVAVVALLIHAFVGLGIWGLALPPAVILHALLTMCCAICIKYPSHMGVTVHGW